MDTITVPILNKETETKKTRSIPKFTKVASEELGIKTQESGLESIL